jgi:hypothetical protein
MNDDRSRLLDNDLHRLQTKIEGSDPDDTGQELLRYHGEKCGRIKVVRLSRRRLAESIAAGVRRTGEGPQKKKPPFKVRLLGVSQS